MQKRSFAFNNFVFKYFRMYKAQHVLALITLFVGLAHSFSWDIAVGARNKLEFYNNGKIAHVEDFGSELDIEHLVYDVIHNRLLITDGNWSRENIIYSFNIETKETLPLVKRKLNGRFHESMYNLAYDPVMEILFWSEKFNIYWFSLKTGFVNNEYGNVLLEHHDLPWSIAVDSCKGYIYWANLGDRDSSSIEKARFDGSEREIILRGDMRSIHVQNLVIDQQTQKMYWTQDIVPRDRPAKAMEYSIRSADLNGHNKTTLFIEGEKNQPRTLAVSKDSIYWVPSFDLSSKIWRLPKNPSADANPEAITVSGWYSTSIAVNYKIEDQIQGVEVCEPLRSLLSKEKGLNQL